MNPPSTAAGDGSGNRIDVACPACGRQVSVEWDRDRETGGGGLVTPEQLAHASCGCYVFDMPSSAFARLLAAVSGL